MDAMIADLGTTPRTVPRAPENSNRYLMQYKGMLLQSLSANWVQCVIA